MIHSLTPQAKTALARIVMKDLLISQSTCDSIAGRTKADKSTTQALLDDLFEHGHVEQLLIAETLRVYRLTPQGHQFLA